MTGVYFAIHVYVMNELIVYILTVGKVKEEWPLYDYPLHYV